jgi:UDP-glucose 4-epimerase
MTMQGYRVLVTGGAGLMGAALVRALLREGAAVRVLDDFSSGRRERLTGLGARLEVVEGDARDLGTVKSALRGASHAVALAGPAEPEEPRALAQVTIEGALTLLSAAAAMVKLDRPRLLFVGAGTVYGPDSGPVLHEAMACQPRAASGVATAAVEGWARHYEEALGVRSCLIRLFRVYGLDEDPLRPTASVVARFVHAALLGNSPRIHGDGQQLVDLTFVEDAVQALVAAVRLCPSGPINVASGESTTVLGLWELVLSVLDQRRVALDPTLVTAPPWIPCRTRPQVTRATQLLRWTPAVRLREGVERAAQTARLRKRESAYAWFAPPVLPASEPAWTGPRAAAPPPRMSAAVETELSLEEDDEPLLEIVFEHPGVSS